jgi:hypothetical protein
LDTLSRMCARSGVMTVTAQRLHAPRQVAPQPLEHARGRRRDDDLVKVPVPHRRFDGLERLRADGDRLDAGIGGVLSDGALDQLRRAIGKLRSAVAAG